MKQNTNQILLDAFAQVDSKVDELHNSSIKSAVRSTLTVVALTGAIIANELTDVLEDQYVDRAKKRASLLAKGV